MSRIWWWAAAIVTLATLLGSAVVYPTLPDKIPTHWNIKGQVDATGSKDWAVFLMPCAMLGLLGLLRAIPWLSPKHFEVDAFQSTYAWIVLLVQCVFAYIHLLTILAALGNIVDFPRAMSGCLFLFFALMGNVLGKVRKNFYVGIRTPWTLASDRVWNDTHRLAARMFVLVGVVGLLFSLVVKRLEYLLIPFGGLAVGVIWVVLYSLVHYKSLQRKGEA